MTVPTAALTNIKKFKWLRERVVNSSSASVLMNHIKDFVLKEEKINLEKIMNAMECQVSEEDLVIKVQYMVSKYSNWLLPFLVVIVSKQQK